jgi:adenine-specific DNA-methyltransferase
MPTLNWIGKEAVVNHHHQVPFRLLKDVPELGCGEPGEGNLIVEGDNLEALKALLPYYAGQVKCIYIDPPYNTGNEGWVYNDNVRSPIIQEWLGKVVGKEGETLDRHDRWLCMMYPRLKLLREFLREDGSIWVSIDDNEVGSLRLILDEVFGRENFVANAIWEKADSPRNSARQLSEDHDHILIYSKNTDWSPCKLPRTAEANSIYKNPDEDPRGPWIPGDPYANKPYSKGRYSFIGPTGRAFSPPVGRYWRVSEEKLRELDADGRIWWGPTGNARPSIKRYLSEVSDLVPRTLWYKDEVGSNRTSKNEMRELFPESESFATPKPSTLIERVLRIATVPGDLVLDSFAGSGTTGHAVLKINAPESAQSEIPARRFILVEMEPEIASKITAERVRRVAEGYTNAKGEKVPGLGGGFRYCRLGDPLFDSERQIRESVTFGELARHVYFTETGEPLPRERVPNTPLLGVCRGVAVYLLFNGILGDKSTNGGNVLTRAILSKLPKHDGMKVIYCAGCLLGADRLAAERIVVRQTPYEVKVS